MVNATNNERTYLIIKKISKSIIIKSMVLGVVSLVFLFSGLVQNPFFVVPVFAEPRDPCWGDECEGTKCSPFGDFGVSCCWTGPNGFDICQICYVLDDGQIDGCDPPTTKGSPDSSTIAPPPSGVAPPKVCPDGSAPDANGNCTPVTQGPKETPSTTTCPDNTALDDKGNCAPVTQGPKETPSTDQGTTQPPPTDDNKPSKPKLPKGDILKLQP
jgi:hypothetical protein